jgi:hypothetical protein
MGCDRSPTTNDLDIQILIVGKTIEIVVAKFCSGVGSANC